MSDARGAFAGFLLGATGMFATMYATQPILPELSRDFGTSDAVAGLTISAVVAAVAAGAWLWGPLSDRIGRRRSLVLASTLVIVPVLGAAAAPTFELLVLARVLQGLCMPGLLIVGVPYVMESFSAQLGKRVMGYYVLSLIAGGFLGRVGVALVTSAAGWRVALGLLAVFNVAGAVIMRRTLPPEPPGGHRRSAGLTALPRLVRNPSLLTATLSASTGIFAIVGMYSYIAFRLEEPPYSLGQAQISFVFALWFLGGTAPIAARFVERTGWRPVALVALVIAIAGAAVSLASPLAVVLLGLGLVSVGAFALVPAAQIGVSEASDADRGLASAMHFSTYYSCSALGAYLPGIAWEREGWSGVVLVGSLALTVPLLVLAAQLARAGRRPAAAGVGQGD